MNSMNSMGSMGSMNALNTAASANSPTTVANKNTDTSPDNLMLMALLGRNIEPAANNLVGPKVSNDVEKIQVRIAYQWKPYYREM